MKLHVISVIVCCLIFTLQAGAQSRGTIRGTVSLEEKNLVLHHVKVLIVQLGQSVETAEDGTYEFKDLPAG
ncbi:MAG: hypothetical protein HY646_00675, partial [Acidobacteria bacterium]|nr:hypothetical protein [Acidobacteriota bacterium]